MTALAVGAIGFYQQFISPYKGFRCAYRARKRSRRRSCSEFAKQLLQRVGVTRFWPLMRRRFDKCRTAAAALATSAGPHRLDYEPRRDEQREQKLDRRADWCEPGGPDCGASVGNDLFSGPCPPPAPLNCDAPSDCTPGDCGSVADAGACSCDCSL